MPKVSVIIPCYNQGEFIMETIGSVEAQTFTDWEIIIVDDGSDVSTKKILDGIAGGKIKIIHTENRGVAAARNTGIGTATGRYVLPVDADDRIGPNYLKEAVIFLDANTGVKVVYCNGEYFGEEVGLIRLPDYDRKKMLQQNLIFCTALFRKADWSACGGYDEDFVTGWEDWEFWLRMIEDDSQVYKLSHVHFYYRIKKVSRNASIQNERQHQAEQQLFTKHRDLYNAFYPEPISLIRDYEYLLGEQQQFELYKNTLHHSASYRIGNIILYPLKRLIRFAKAK